MLAEELAFIKATQEYPDLDGKQWERIYANSVGASYSPSNRKVIDIEKGKVGFSIKTIKSTKKLEDLSMIRIIQCRPDPRLIKIGNWQQNPQEVGHRIINDWNFQVSKLEEDFDVLKEVVLIRAQDFNSFCLCQYDVKRLNKADYYWKWNKRGNLEGFSHDEAHRFTWQPGGSQWTIKKTIPDSKQIIKFDKQLKHEFKPKRKILELLGWSHLDLPQWQNHSEG